METPVDGRVAPPEALCGGGASQVYKKVREMAISPKLDLVITAPDSF